MKLLLDTNVLLAASVSSLSTDKPCWHATSSRQQPTMLRPQPRGRRGLLTLLRVVLASLRLPFVIGFEELSRSVAHEP